MAEELVFTMDQEQMDQNLIDQDSDTDESRAAKTGSTAAKKPAAKTGSTAAKKPAAKTGSAAAGKKPAAKTGSTAAVNKRAAKTGSTAAKKKTTSSSIRLSAAEKKLIENYRKCNDMTKTMISAVVEKIAGTKAASQTDQASGQNQQDNGLLGNLDLGNLDLGGLLNIFGK